MKTDAIVLGAELDGFLAAARMLERGLSVQILCSGAGGLHYAPAGIHVLGFHSDAGNEILIDPLAAISDLDPRHPYRKVGNKTVADGLQWFSGLCAKIGFPITLLENNTLALTPMGLGVPVMGMPPHLATVEVCKVKSVAVIEFPGMRDFPVELICAELIKNGVSTHVVEAPLPGNVVENVALAKSFDRLTDPSQYFTNMKFRIPSDAEVLLFPAVMGLRKNLAICTSAESVLDIPCFEVSTLPTSVPGLRLELSLKEHLQSQGIEFVANFRVQHASSSAAGAVVSDDRGRCYKADVAIVATGGVLMSGLEVQPCGTVRERLFNLGVEQTRPLATVAVDQTLNALHRVGVETNAMLNPLNATRSEVPNLFVTGQTLAHSNPAAESSADGISIATGWAAAENACDYLKEADHG